MSHLGLIKKVLLKILLRRERIAIKSILDIYNQFNSMF
jgi:hypothetical protein